MREATGMAMAMEVTTSERWWAFRRMREAATQRARRVAGVAIQRRSGGRRRSQRGTMAAMATAVWAEGNEE
jgi:hypothetical protein